MMDDLWDIRTGTWNIYIYIFRFEDFKIYRYRFENNFTLVCDQFYSSYNILYIIDYITDFEAFIKVDATIRKKELYKKEFS